VRAREARREVLDALEGERRRISRELHDELGQHLSAITLFVGLLKDRGDLSPEAAATLERLEAAAREADASLDFMVWELRPKVLKDRRLADALRQYVESWSAHFGIPARLEVGTVAPEVDPDVETVLYRAAQEALTNVARHARAREVSLLLESRGNDLCLDIRDDGVGFHPADLAQDSARGAGLVGMRERFTLIGGSVEIDSAPGRGTTLKFCVPARRA
jgi:signal transduction histidine kinase